MASTEEPHEFVVDESAKDSRFPDLCLVCGYSEKSKSTQHISTENPREEIQRLMVEQLATRLNVPVELIGVAHIKEPLKLSSTELEPGDVVVYLKPDDGVLSLHDRETGRE